MSVCDKSVLLIESYGNESVFEHWCQFKPVSPLAHQIVGCLLIIICILSIAGNLLVVVVFTRYRRLRSPANTLIVNLAVSDMLNGFLHPMAAYSAFKESWMFGKIGCEAYAAGCGLFGLVSIVTLTTIAIERCMVISLKPLYGGNLFSRNKAKIAVVFVWIYCLIIMTPPLLGWGAFVPEGFLTSCSFDYLTRDHSTRSYFFFIFFLGFFFPIIVITICYTFIMKTILQNEKEMKKNNVKKLFKKPRRRNDYKAAEMIMFVIAMFLLSWTPYSLVACIGQFGNKNVLTPWVSVLPSLFAKMSTIYNPAIYGFSHRNFRATLRKILTKKQKTHSSGDKGMSRNYSSLTKSRTTCCMPTYGNGTTSSFEDSHSAFEAKKIFIELQALKSECNQIVYFRKTQNVELKQVPKQCECGSKIKAQWTTYNPNYFRSSTAILTSSTKMESTLKRSRMFRSECSIHQKYLTLLEQDHILKVPTVIYFRNEHRFLTKTFSYSNYHALQ